MLTYNGQPLKFTSYSKIENESPEWVAQTRMDELGHTLQIWKVGEQYYVTIA